MNRFNQKPTADPMQWAARDHNKEADNISNHILYNKFDNYNYQRHNTNELLNQWVNLFILPDGACRAGKESSTGSKIQRP